MFTFTVRVEAGEVGLFAVCEISVLPKGKDKEIGRKRFCNVHV